MTPALFRLQILCILLFALSLIMARLSRREAWLWLMGLAGLGIVVCAGLATWGPLLGLGWR